MQTDCPVIGLRPLPGDDAGWVVTTAKAPSPPASWSTPPVSVPVSRPDGRGRGRAHPSRKGEEYLLDKRLAGLVHRVIYPCPSPTSKGTLVIPTYDGTIMIGPTADLVDDPEDLTTSAAGADRILAAARRLVPGISERDVIAQFAGLRAVLDDEDFLIGPTEAPGFFNVAGIQSPGLTAAPAIARYVAELLGDAGLDVEPVRAAERVAPPVRFAHLSDLEQQTLAADEPAHRQPSSAAASS